MKNSGSRASRSVILPPTTRIDATYDNNWQPFAGEDKHARGEISSKLLVIGLGGQKFVMSH